VDDERYASFFTHFSIETEEQVIKYYNQKIKLLYRGLSEIYSIFTGYLWMCHIKYVRFSKSTYGWTCFHVQLQIFWHSQEWRMTKCWILFTYLTGLVSMSDVSTLCINNASGHSRSGLRGHHTWILFITVPLNATCGIVLRHTHVCVNHTKTFPHESRHMEYYHLF
jgi:hypothetical protein